MSNNYIYPKETFKVSLELEVSVGFVGMWKGHGKDFLETKYESMLKDGTFSHLLKRIILDDLVKGEAFDIDSSEPFDRLCFTIKNSDNESEI